MPMRFAPTSGRHWIPALLLCISLWHFLSVLKRSGCPHCEVMSVRILRLQLAIIFDDKQAAEALRPTPPKGQWVSQYPRASLPPELHVIFASACRTHAEAVLKESKSWHRSHRPLFSESAYDINSVPPQRGILPCIKHELLLLLTYIN